MSQIRRSLSSQLGILVASAVLSFFGTLTAAGQELTSSPVVRQFDPASNSWVRKKVAVQAIGRTSQASPIPAEIVAYQERVAAGTIIIETAERRLYYVLGDGVAIRYGIGVGREGFAWRGTERVSRKAEWPAWTPPPEMIRREAVNGRFLPSHMEGGPENPLGARALYLGSTLFRIHGTSQPWTIGQAVSSGCIRMTNADIIELYEQVEVGALVIVR